MLGLLQIECHIRAAPNQSVINTTSLSTLA
jgi:hypothetical protein